MVRGRYPIGVGIGENDLRSFRKQGLGRNVSPLPDSFYKVQQMSPGFGAVGFIDHAPHPNAAAVYVNWLLSRQGQEAWAGVPRNSRRIDVKPGDPSSPPHPGVTYFNGMKEITSKTRFQLQEIAKEMISADGEAQAQAVEEEEAGIVASNGAGRGTVGGPTGHDRIPH